MKLQKIISATLVGAMVTTLAFAQDASVSAEINANLRMPAPPPQPPQGQGQGEGRPGFFGRLLNGEERQEIRQETMEARAELRQGIMERRQYMMASGTATGSRPTPFKDFKEDMKDIRKDVMQMRAELNATATAAIAAKLGITVEALQAQLASGTPLHEIIKGTFTEEELRAILPPRATPTNSMSNVERRGPQGFFNSLRMKLFGGPQNKMEGQMGGDVNAGADANVMANTDGGGQMNANVEVRNSIRLFFRNLFGF